MKALVIGGTGPTGPYLVNGLIARGYEVAMLHRGTHELDENPPEVEHIHVDPHFRETIDPALAGRTFDVVIATYGRIRVIAEALIGITPRLITIGGPPSYRGMFNPQDNYPPGMPIPTPENAQRIESSEEASFGWLIRQTEDTIMGFHKTGRYDATTFRYPMVYGPNAIGSLEWLIMKRAQDKRKQIALPDSGLTVVSRGYAENMAHAVLLAVDKPDASAGKIYNCADEQGVSVGAWAQMIARCMDWEFEICGIPDAYAHTSRDFLPLDTSTNHQLMDLSQIKHDLGYRDIVPMQEAIPRTVAWMLKYRPDNDGKFSNRDDPLNYALEDQLLAIYNEAIAKLQKIPFRRKEVHHPYPHPKVAGQARDHRNR